MKIKDSNALDKRLIKRHIAAGVVSAEDYDQHLDQLEDLTDKADVILAEMSDMGVHDVQAKDTGESDE